MFRSCLKPKDDTNKNNLLTFECPICMNECVGNQLTLDTCKHTVCFECIHSMYRNKNIFKYFNVSKCKTC